MINPFQAMQQRMQSNSMAQGINQAAGIMQALQNPMQTMLNSNPQLTEVFKYAQQFGGNFEQAFYNYVKENNISNERMNEVLAQAKQMMSR